MLIDMCDTLVPLTNLNQHEMVSRKAKPSPSFLSNKLSSTSRRSMRPTSASTLCGRSSGSIFYPNVRGYALFRFFLQGRNPSNTAPSRYASSSSVPMDWKFGSRPRTPAAWDRKRVRTSSGTCCSWRMAWVSFTGMDTYTCGKRNSMESP